MNYSTVTYSLIDRTAIVTMNQPKKRNALDDILINELTQVLQMTGRSNDSRVVILTGSGESFCAGMDLDYLKMVSEKPHDENVGDARKLLKLLETILTLRKPVVAMVNGPALGGGCGLAAACDFVFAGHDKARLGTPEVQLGFVPAVILIFLIKRIGEGKAKELVLRGNVLSAEEAREIGLVTQIVEDDKLETTTLEFADKLASTTSASSISLTKGLFARLNDMDLREVLEYAANLNALARKTDDFKKGIESFIKKEKLQW